MNGRIESYIHSDVTTRNKGGCIIRVLTETDFAARTSSFIEFCKRAAKFCYGSTHLIDIESGEENVTWELVSNTFPMLEEERVLLERELKESVVVGDIAVLTL